MDPSLRELQQQIATAVDGLSEEQMIRHPPGKWSIAEVLEHLYLTYTGTIKGFERAAAASKPLATSPTWRQRGRSLVVLGVGYLPPGREAPPFARPRGLPTEKVVTEIGPKIAEMDELIGRIEEKFGKRTKLDHPILGPITGYQWRRFHLIHGMHHIKQIQRLRLEAK